MTVMLDRFFGVHPHVIRSGLWARMKPGEKDLYVFLMEQSERHRTRELRATDRQIAEAVGVAPRTLCNSRKKLWEYGLIQYKAGNGNRYIYTICNPVTGLPYPGDPKAAPAKYEKPIEGNGNSKSQAEERPLSSPAMDFVS